MELAMSRHVRFPYMRLEVISAVRSLSDPVHQLSVWGNYKEDTNYYDDLTINLHTLYDDCMVLPEPQSAVPDILYQEEVPALRDLESALGPMIRDLGEEPDRVYIRDLRWHQVVEAAARALEVMEQSDEGGRQ